MKGYCEWCGTYQSLAVPIPAEGLGGNVDETLHLCPDCRRRAEPLAVAKSQIPRADPSLGRYVAAVEVTAVLAVFVAAMLFDSGPSSTAVNGDVLGAYQLGPGADPTQVVAHSPARASDPITPRGSSASDSGSPPAVVESQGHAQDGPALSRGRASIQTWTNSFGTSRLQVIEWVRNDDARWVRFPDKGSTYRILDGTREVASGAYIALPAVIGPGETAYLVQTISLPVDELARRLSAESAVAAVPTDPPTVTLSITGLRLTSGVGGSVRALGLVHNDGRAATRPVIAGAIALDSDGRPLAALYDTFDVGRIDPGEARPFATDYDPGAPPVIAGSLSELVGVAFEAGS